MEKFSKILMSGLAALCLWACSDEANVSRPTDAENDVYVEFGVQLMQGSGSRSTTTDAEDENGSNSTDGAEVGKDYENSVKEILLVLTKADGSPIVSQRLDVEPKEDGKYPRLVTTLDRSALEAYRTGEIYAYAFCNPTSSIDINDLTHSIHTLSGEPELTDNDEIWKRGAFLMANHNQVKVANSTPATIWNWEQYTETNRLSLGTISVERACARFDFKANSYPTTEPANTYVLESTNGVSVLLTDMVMVNISKNFYHLRRVSADGLAADIDLCGQETSNNYVVDTDADKKNGNVGETYKKDYFLNKFLSNSAEEWIEKFTPISSLTEEDNDESWNAEHNRNGYKIWRYATENTIPAPNSNQKNGISTGVIFKGKLQFNKSTYGVTGNHQPIYVYNNVLYGTWEKVTEAANLPNADESLKAVYAQIGAIPADNAEFGKAGFTVLRPNTSGDYEMYYCYWNRHNDNNDPNLMGTMEFAVVRNNVYKLMVNKINGYGHPTSLDPKDDPDPLDPNDPDERNDLYIEVTVEVRPWVVRINDIDF